MSAKRYKRPPGLFPMPKPIKPYADPGGQGLRTAPDGTPLGALIFEEKWETLSLRNPLAHTGRWSTTGWPGELIIGDWNNIGVVTGHSLADQQTWYINNTNAAVSSIVPWVLGDGFCDLIASKTPDAHLADCGNMPVVSGLLTTYETFAWRYGYLEWDVQVITGDFTLPIGGLWPAQWQVPQAIVTYGLSGPGDLGTLRQAQRDLPESDISEMMDPFMRQETSTFHREIGTSDTRDYQAYVATYALDTDARSRHRKGLLRTPDWEISYLDGAEVGRRAQTPASAAVYQYLYCNMGMGGAFPTREDPTTHVPLYPLDLDKLPIKLRLYPIRCWALA